MIPQSWIVILEGGGDREELITRSIPAHTIRYNGRVWRRATLHDVMHIACYLLHEDAPRATAGR